MVLLDSHIQQCVDFVSPIIKLIAENTADVINSPLNSNSFESELLEFNWEPLLNSKKGKSDLLTDLVLKRLVTDLLSSEDVHDDLTLHVKKCSVILDFCFHSKQYREKPTSWIVVYFELFSTIFDMLNWPNATLKFWPYVESRMDWFKMGNSLEPLPFGSTNMISYKQPLYDKLRHWNDLLKMVQNNSSLNTPLDNIMSYKLTKFLSELLPLHEESNFNRSALISTKQGSGNPWNKTISSATKRDNSSENVFATDYNYVFDNLLTCPLEFAFRPTEHKVDLDKVLSNLLDSIFETEEDFYRGIKNSHKKLVDINEKLNHQYPCEYEYSPKTQPSYLKNSSRLMEEREAFWHKFCSLRVSTVDMLQPTLLDVSTANPDTLYIQMMETDNDFYRKQFLLQLYFTINMVRQIVTLPEVEKFYKLCYQKEKPSRSINFDNLDETNRRKTSALCNHILDNRISKFYRHRDPPLASLLQRLAAKDKKFLEAKADGFKVFQSFQVLEHSLEPLTFNYAFKKFGFVEMGNKLVNNVWKINTGLDKIKRPQGSVKELYDSLHEKFNSGEPVTPSTEYDDKVIKEWQYLRSLRPQYLFEFNKVDENVGIKGLFDPSLMESQKKKKRELFQSILQETRRPHMSKLEEARNYIAEKQRKKRAHEEEMEENSHKKAKVESPEGPTTNPEQAGELIESKSSEGPAETFEKTLSQPVPSETIEETKEPKGEYKEQSHEQFQNQEQIQKESHQQDPDQARQQEHVQKDTQEQEQGQDQTQKQTLEEFKKPEQAKDIPEKNTEVSSGQESEVPPQIPPTTTDINEQEGKDTKEDPQDGNQAVAVDRSVPAIQASDKPSAPSQPEDGNTSS